ncbi:MAG: DUF1294 domain-containing protein [Proteobacteria bacterium]|nr:DUF1294 domain-containing protein [Pseudomonadota bacterium]
MSSLLIAPFLLVINIIAFATFWFDKRAAIHGERRVPESTLLLMAFLGGSAGALVARQVFRHKTRKQPFASLLIGIALLQIAAVAVWLVNRTH